jgi:hypothetical protein
MKKELTLIAIVFIIITAIFFYPIFKGYIPFPGDLLVGEFVPYNSYSYLGFNPAGVPNKAQGIDVIRQLYPWKYFAVESFKHLQIPFWTPYNFSGNPLLANFQSGIFYPLNFIFFLLPFINAWTIYIFLIPALSCWFMYMYLREIGVSKIGSIYGGIVFAFSSYMVVWLEWGNIGHALLWLPLCLYITEKYIKKATPKRAAFLILALWLSLLAGYIQIYFYNCVIFFFFFLLKSFQKKKKIFKKTAVYFFIILSPVLLSLFQVLPTIELFQNSNRTNYSIFQIKELLNPWWYLITIFIPDFFGNPASRNFWFPGTYIERVSYFGVIPFILALIALVSFKKKKEIGIFAALMIFSLIFATDLFITKYIYLLPIPVLSTTVPTRILSIFVVSASILSAIGFDLYFEKKYGKKFIIAFILPVALLILCGSFIFFAPKIISSTSLLENLAISRRNIILPAFFVTAFIILHFLLKIFKDFKRKKIAAQLLIIFLTLFDLFYFFQKITPFAPKEFLYPRTEVISYLQEKAGMNRFWGYGSAYISSNMQAYDRTFSPEGYDPLSSKIYTEFISSSRDGVIRKNLPRSDANIAAGFGPLDLDNNQYRQKVLNILGVKYLLNKNELLKDKAEPDTTTFNPKKYKLVWQKTPWQIYENLQALPRVMITADFKVIEDPRLAIQTILTPSFNEGKRIVLSEDPNITPSSSLSSSLKIIDYQPNKIEINSQTDKSALLFISDNYYPGWRVFVDNEEKKILKADYAFRAVVLPKGNHKVIIYYDPDSFKIGLIISSIFAVLLIIFLNKKKFI